MIISFMITHPTLCNLLLKEDIKPGDKIMFSVTLAINHKVSQFTGKLQ